MTGKLAEFFPGVIDKLIPEGKIPEGGTAGKGHGNSTIILA
jgi:uncharacterized protein YidB (DUF937 family)